MMQRRIRAALCRYLEIAGGPALGGARASPDARRRALRNDLAAMRRENRTWLLLYVGLLTALFVIVVALAVARLDDPVWIATYASATGVSLAWILTNLRHAWRDKWYVDLLTLTLDGMGQDALDQLALLLVEKLTRGRPKPSGLTTLA